MRLNKKHIPLVVDLDHTLINSDCFHEGLLLWAKKHPFSLWKLLAWLIKDKAHLKHQIFKEIELDFSHMPLIKEVVSFCEKAQSEGRSVYIATGTPSIVASGLQKRLPIFTEIIGTTPTTNTVGKNKALALVEKFGAQGFDFISDHPRDLPVFKQCLQGYIPASVMPSWADKVGCPIELIQIPASSIKDIFKLIRPQQWVKNGLLFAPLILAHQFSNIAQWGLLGKGFVAFSLVASSVYVFNDLIDFSEDRLHPKKKCRPIATGALSIPKALCLGLCLVASGFSLSLITSGSLFVMLLVYIGLNFLYSIYLKKMPIADVFVLSSFYVIRLLTGGIITNIPITNWLLAFSFFLFLGLGILKRYCELQILIKQNRLKAGGRGYLTQDKEVLFIVGFVSSSFSVLILGLYLEHINSLGLYAHAQWLWGFVILLMFWVTYAWFHAHRGDVHDDPVSWALSTPLTWIISIASVILYCLAV